VQTNGSSTGSTSNRPRPGSSSRGGLRGPARARLGGRQARRLARRKFACGRRGGTLFLDARAKGGARRGTATSTDPEGGSADLQRRGQTRPGRVGRKERDNAIPAVQEILPIRGRFPSNVEKHGIGEVIKDKTRSRALNHRLAPAIHAQFTSTSGAITRIVLMADGDVGVNGHTSTSCCWRLCPLMRPVVELRQCVIWRSRRCTKIKWNRRGGDDLQYA